MANGPNSVQGSSVGGYPVFYSVTYPDQFSPSTVATITTATTTQVIAGVAGQYIYAYFLGAFTTGTNSSTIAFSYGPNSSTLTPLLMGTTFANYTTANAFTYFYGGYKKNTAYSYAFYPSPVPLIIPAGQNLYMITAGSTIAVKPVYFYAQH